MPYDNDNNIKALGFEEIYRYLGILDGGIIKHTLIKKNITKEYNQCLNNFLYCSQN